MHKPRQYESPSSLARYVKCPYSYNLRYMNQVERASPGQPAMFGSYVHKVLADLFEFAMMTQFRGTIDGSYIRLKARAFAGEYGQGPVQIEECYALIHHYFQRIGPIDHQNHLAAEQTTEVNLDGIGPVLCIIDRVDKVGPDSIEVVDYKTGKDWNDYQLQVILYMAAVRKLYDWCLNVSFNLEFLKLGISKKITMSASQLTEHLDEVKKIKSRIDAGMFEPVIGMHCKWCDVKAACMFVQKKG